MIKVSVIGATGYTGGELIKILLNHPEIKLVSLFAKLEKPEVRIDDEFPSLKGKTDAVCHNFTPDKLPTDVDIVFLAVPHTVAIEMAPLFLEKNIKVIDLSADFRLKDHKLYEKWYGKTHTNPSLLKDAIYGSPELYRDKIKSAKLLANPGCFPTSIILGISPILNSVEGTLFIDSKTGTSGAGKKAALGLIFSECTNNIRPYKVLNHQHTPEIEQILSDVAGKKINICFVPELAPLDRGIITSIFVKLKTSASTKDVLNVYNKFYKDAPFVQVLPEDTFPELKNVIYTNMCHIGVKSTGNELLVISAIDNLVKGAAGQAVQNMNIMFGIKEDMGLK
jgi:N-acetyl-gamma-glutamyl-phosphate reductase